MDTSQQLAETFADNFVMSYRAHSCHFNVTGEDFYSLHKLFQKIYEDSEAIQDDLGELIRALGDLAPETIGNIMSCADLEDAVALENTPEALLELVLDGQLHMIHSYEKLEVIADSEDHKDIANFAQDRIRKHKKFAWMLRATLE